MTSLRLALPVRISQIAGSSRWGDRTAVNTNLERNIRRIAVAAVIILAFLNAADTVTTKLLLEHAPAGAIEANPLAGLLLANGSLLLVKFAIIAALGVAVLWDRPRLGLTVGLSGACGLYFAAVTSNILLLRMF